MPNNNKIAISRGYAIKTADLSIYNRDQSEFVVEKNTVVVSAKSDIRKINRNGTMNFQDDRPISPRVNRTTLAGGIITNGLRSGATVPSNTPNTNKSMDYIRTNQSNTAMRDGDYNFTTGKFNSSFPQVAVDRPGFDNVLAPIITFFAAAAMNAEAGGGEGDNTLGGVDEPNPANDAVDPNDDPVDSNPGCLNGVDINPAAPPIDTEHNNNPGCCITYTRTKEANFPHRDKLPNGDPSTPEVWTKSCARVEKCGDCANARNLDDMGECTVTISYNLPSTTDLSLRLKRYLWRALGIPIGKVDKFLISLRWTHRYACKFSGQCDNKLNGTDDLSSGNVPLQIDVPPYTTISWPDPNDPEGQKDIAGSDPRFRVPQEPGDVIIKRVVTHSWSKKISTDNKIDTYQTYKTYSQSDCNGDGDCTPSVSMDPPEECGICSAPTAAAMFDVCAGFAAGDSKVSCLECRDAIMAVDVPSLTEEECAELSCYFSTTWTPGIIVDDECTTAY